jgi:hypothetical protein
MEVPKPVVVKLDQKVPALRIPTRLLKSKKKTGEEKKSETSKMDSSFAETSEDDSTKKAREAAEAKKKKKGLTPEELEIPVDIELSETRTTTLLHIPGTYVKQ